jgi:hypothetical protein
MFSIKTPHNCKIIRNINTGVTPNLYVYNDKIYTNTQVNSIPNSSCIINTNTSYGQQLINEPYNPLKNPLV